MEKNMLNSYLDVIGGMIVDEKKIVTYKSLSKSLGIHVNTAKQLLHTYFRQQQKEKSFPICATYLLAGKLKDGSLRVTIVNESEKKEEKSKFIEISTNHVYSIQGGKSLKDIKVLCGIGKEIEEKNRQCVIECTKCTIESGKKLKNQDKGLESNHNKLNDEIKESLESSTNVKPEIAHQDVKKSENLLKNTNEKTSKSPKKPISTNAKSKTEKKHASANKKRGNIENFFANSTHKTLLKSEIQENEWKPSDEKKNESKVIQPERKEVKKDTVDFNSEKCHNKKNSKKKIEGNKRKRIQVLSDSEDSDFSNEDLPVEEPQETMQMFEDDADVNEETNLKSKRKKRKLVDVTVMSDDGYLETRKEVTMATDSEDEVETTLKPSKNENSESEKAKTGSREKELSVPNIVKKQSSLLNFFKKK